MAKRITVVVSQGQSANPAKRALEEELVAGLLFEPGVEVTVVPHLYDLQPDGTAMLCLQGITGDMIVLSWLFPRGAHWILDRNSIRGQFGATLLSSAEDDDEDFDEEEGPVGEADGDSGANGAPPADLPARKIYCLDLRHSDDASVYFEEIRRIAQEVQTQTVELTGLSPVSPTNGKPAAENGHAAEASLPIVAAASNGAENPASTQRPAEPIRVEESAPRRWYPVIDFSRCTNCMECIDFCLFGVYGVDGAERILVEQPDNCRKGCPACSRVCPENAIIFPQHKTPAIAGATDAGTATLKIDLSKLFGAPDAMEVAVIERDRELVADGRDAVGMNVGIPKRRQAEASEPKDDLDNLMDQLDELDL